MKTLIRLALVPLMAAGFTLSGPAPAVAGEADRMLSGAASLNAGSGVHHAAKDWKDRRDFRRDRRETRRATREDRRDFRRDRRETRRATREDRREWREDRRDRRADRRDWRQDRREWRRDRREFKRDRWRGERRAYRHGYRDGRHAYKPHKRYKYRNRWGYRVGHYVPYRRYRVIHDYRTYGYPPPRRGYGYVSIDGDVFLVALATGLLVTALTY